MCAVKQSRSHLRCSQVVKQQKRWSKFFDPGRSCDYSAYGSDHPLVPEAPVDALQFLYISNQKLEPVGIRLTNHVSIRAEKVRAYYQTNLSTVVGSNKGQATRTQKNNPIT